MEPTELLKKYLLPNQALYEIVYRHGQEVAQFALRCLDQHPDYAIDRQFVYEASLLHDIGVGQTYAPGIHCHGTYPYLCHGYLGADLLRAEQLDAHALVCERHTGTGLDRKALEARGWPFPMRDMLPCSEAEQLICFADKFFSKTHLGRERSVKKAREKLEKFGQEGLARFDYWCERFL